MKIIPDNKTLANMTVCLAITLMALGAVFVFSASARIDAEYDLSRFYSYPEFRQISFFLTAVLIVLGFSLLDYRAFALSDNKLVSWLTNPSVYMVAASIILLILVLVTPLGVEVNNARRWIRIPAGPATINFQPSELAKWSLVLFLPAVSAMLGKKLQNFFKGFVPVFLLIGLVAGLILLEDFGTALFVAFIGLAILFMAGGKWWHFLTPLPLLIVIFALAIVSSPMRIERIKTFASPTDSTAQTSGYQIRQSLIAVSTGGLWGKGLGRGISKYGHLPEDTTDFIFAIIAEELGFVGVCFVTLLFVLFLILGILITYRCRDDFGKLLAFGIVLTINFQAAVNLGVVTRLLPTKGIALPFISAGGTHIFLTAAAAGILAGIARRSESK
ncbi:MAG: stage V sporulation protein E [Planctomycetes bacterium HGW-Planctomycetes-1]|nr:MAG: stage V sporulation protein E [Planctomycetes bacterium HGW-Planctomycetes-1]